MKTDRADMKALAKTALRTAEERYGVTDDMTVIAVRLETRT